MHTDNTNTMPDTTPDINDLRKLHELYGNKLTIEEVREQLDEAGLLEWFEEDAGFFGHMLRHPMHYAVPFMLCEGEVRRAIECIDAKQERVAQLDSEGGFDRAIFMHERPYRFQAFMERRSRMIPEVAANIMGEVWIDSENIRQHLDEWSQLWAWVTARDLAALTMREDDERKKLLALQKAGDTWIYRGVNRTRQTKLGLSWTTDRERAIWFASRFVEDPADALVYSTIVPLCDAPKAFMACFDGRGEDEVVVHPAWLADNEHTITEAE